jgi:hypothetical protein
MSSSLLPSHGKTNVVVAGASLAIPQHTAKLLFVSHGGHPPHRSDIGISISLDILDGQIRVDGLSPDEPSTIYTAMPIRRPADPTLIPGPDYYPSYGGLSPEQKWIYLNWLTDVTQPVNTGYVFIYYYGLERHLLVGELDSAFDEILLLRRTHAENASFDSYSRSALLNSALFRKRGDRLEQLYRLSPPARLENTDLILAHQLGYDLGPEGLIRLAATLPGVAKRYIKKNPDKCGLALAAVLTEEFGQPLLPFASCYRISELPKKQQLLFANISFPSEIRTPALPSFLHYEPFLREVARVLSLTHERTKQALADARRRNRRSPGATAESGPVTAPSSTSSNESSSREPPLAGQGGTDTFSLLRSSPQTRLTQKRGSPDSHVL